MISATISKIDTVKKVTFKIATQCAGKSNAYSLCCIFTVFYCKFHAHMLYFLRFPVFFPAHALEI